MRSVPNDGVVVVVVVVVVGSDMQRGGQRVCVCVCVCVCCHRNVTHMTRSPDISRVDVHVHTLTHALTPMHTWVFALL